MGKDVRWISRRAGVFRRRVKHHYTPTWAEIKFGHSLVSVQYSPWRGWVAVTLWPQGRFAPWTPLPWESALGGLTVKRVEIGGTSGHGSGGIHLAPVDSDLFSKVQGLVGHMADIRYDDGGVRRPGWITIKTMGASWVVQIKDPDACASIQAIGATLDDAMALAELLVTSEAAPWEHDPWLAKSQTTKPAKKS